ncbi:MAG TPA: hypothetical protein VG317_10595 [Pseudonocardiaceae bacterium]|nr:hypothetical protein [Pseudonocardiaceae bacterium]
MVNAEPSCGIGVSGMVIGMTMFSDWPPGSLSVADADAVPDRLAPPTRSRPWVAVVGTVAATETLIAPVCVFTGILAGRFTEMLVASV